MSRLLKVALASFAVFFLLTTRAAAQSEATTGVIEGTVVDATGAVLPGATVSLKNTATNYQQNVTTDRGGRFRGLLLPLGPYRVTVTLSGFATLVRDGVTLAVGQTVTLNLKLELSSVKQEVRVTAEAPVVETSQTASAVRIDEKAVQNLPNAAHNFLDFTKMTPGVATVQGPDGDELTINGQKGINNNVSVDGADFNNPFFGEQRGGQRPPFTFNLDAVQEVVVIADGAGAEFGRSSSGFVNVVTKSGTNDIHGSGHLYYKDQGLASRAASQKGGTADKFDFNRYQAGVTLGGPFQQDKLFYFLAADAQRGRSTKQTDPARIEPGVVTALAGFGIANDNGPIERTDDALVILAKADWHISQAHLATLRFAYTWSEQKNGTFDVDSWGRSSNAIEKDFSKALTGTLISTLSSTLVNELRFQIAREDRPRPYEGPNITGQNRPLPDTAFDFTKHYRFGEPFFIPVQYYDTRLQFNDNVSFVLGEHTVKAGVEYNRVNSTQTFLGFANGRWIFSSTKGFLEYLKNSKYVECSNAPFFSDNGICPNGGSVTGPVLFYQQQAGVGGFTVEEAGTQSIIQKEPAVFVQDTWQPIPNLTINAGLRWETQIQPDPRTPPDQVFFAKFIGQTRNGQEFPSDGTIPTDYKMWQPRLGISWDPQRDGRTVVRGTYGIYYASVPGLNLASTRSTNGSIGQSVFTNSFLHSRGFTPTVPVYPNLIPASQIGSPFQPDVYVFDKNFQNPRTTAVSFGVEREVMTDMAVSFKYNYAKGEHITRFVNRNDPLLGKSGGGNCLWDTGLSSGSGIGCGLAGLPTGLMTVESTGKSKYWGLTFGINKRFSHSFGFQAYYTYSKDRSDDDNERDPFSINYAKVTDLAAEYGYSNRDQRHRFNSWFVWNAPLGIDVNARYSYRSHQPKSITATGADANTPLDRCLALNPDGSGSCDPIKGVVERNLGRKDNQFSSLDLRLSKEFLIAGLVIEPSVEIFNLFNSKNFLSPEVTNLVFNFDGTIRSGNGDPRQVQLGLRIHW
jgi:outer membrane receptor for ferrienterochelin and colicin